VPLPSVDFASPIRRCIDELRNAKVEPSKTREKGIKSPPTIPLGSGDRWKMVAKQQVLKILRNPIHLGCVRWGELTKADCHPAIIGDEQFDRVQWFTEPSRGQPVECEEKPRMWYNASRFGAMPLRSDDAQAAHGQGGNTTIAIALRSFTSGRKECNAPGVSAELLEERSSSE
jgi:hypothetical protein